MALKEVVPSSGDRTAALKRESNKRKLIEAYTAFQRQEPLSLDRLLGVVTKFAKTKVNHLEHDFKGFGSGETADDWAQEVTIRVWQALQKSQFEGTPEQFYSWVHKIAFNRATDAFNDLDDEQRKQVPLSVTRYDAEGEEYEDDNPTIYDEGSRDFYIGDGVDENGNVKYKLGNRFEGIFTIPDSIQGVDRDICRFIVADKTYAEIGEILGMSEGAVTRRIQRMRERNKK